MLFYLLVLLHKSKLDPTGNLFALLYLKSVSFFVLFYLLVLLHKSKLDPTGNLLLFCRFCVVLFTGATTQKQARSHW